MNTAAIYTESELANRVHDLVRAYVMVRTERRSGISWDAIKDFTIVNDEIQRLRAKYRDAREKVCLDSFLAMRGRRSRADFIAYFTGTICSVPQFLPREEHAKLALKLLNESEGWEDVKSLAMLALAGLASVRG